MRIRNTHQRTFPASPEQVGRLLDGLSGNPDPLWPAGPWPPMRFDRPLQAGAVGGHGPVRYRVEEYTPGQRVRFAFTGPPGLTGTHDFSVEPAEAGAKLRHTIAGRASGAMLLAWPLLLRPFHDALLEDALDKAELALTGKVARPNRWSWWVRFLRRAAERRVG
jgi:hypothetical protein